MSNTQPPTLADALLRLLDELLSEWTPAEREEAKHFVDVGEYGLALETIAGIAMEESRPLPDRARAEVETLAAPMHIAQGDVISALRRSLTPGAR